ncbi:ATP-binding protein [Herminiimonas fonticola]|uniref:histidine kinase n=1 Tax=Herminiimonas fonticola TaxID=303380 RepID=A0A4R6G0A6_9BURK|nr:ATP-binding protein [Herminiimonas fonticola]RBA22884.1 PAS domain S-box protein [Herminiimonas fonticola]TDN87692.1 PAS domain S-box-containing protein [Herminiimonas fonticola]
MTTSLFENFNEALSSGSVINTGYRDILNSLPVPMFVKDVNHRFVFVNKLACTYFDKPASEIIGKSDEDFFSAEQSRQFWEMDDLVFSTGKDNENEEVVTRANGASHTLVTRKSLFVTDEGKYLLVSINDITTWKKVEVELRSRNAELVELNAKFSAAQEQLIQSEKLASIGQLAAGVAHEINNPIGYIFSNFGALETYIANLLEMLDAYERTESLMTSPEARASLDAVRKRVELDYVKEDMPMLLSESKEGIVRVRKIVQDLKDFSHVDVTQEWQWADLHHGIDSTLNIVANEVKYKADVIKEYGDIPEVECLPSQINQVVMNLVVNAAHAISGEQRGKITIRTGVRNDNVWIEIQDTGSGIPKEVLPRIFDPFFTTKPVGSGTGLGLSLSYGIIQKHQGQMEVESEFGSGTCFRISLPVQQATVREVAK